MAELGAAIVTKSGLTEQTQAFAGSIPNKVASSKTCVEISQESVAPNDEENHPLPVVGSWNASTWWNFKEYDAGFDPIWQLEMIDRGHHLLPWFNIPLPDLDCPQGSGCNNREYFEQPIERCAKLGLPISFVGTQWEHHLYDDPFYFSLPAGENPNVVTTDGTVEKKLSPFGPPSYWYEVGRKWGSTRTMGEIIGWYPDPPCVVFISNNEAEKLHWRDAEQDKQYLKLYGRGRDAAFKRRVFGDAWKLRYCALIKGFRDALPRMHWREKSKFVAYQAFGPGWFGEWAGWKDYSLSIPSRISPDPLFWEGGSSSAYIYAAPHNERDNNVAGPLFQAMNWTFMLEEAYLVSRKFWYELSTWEGDSLSRDRYRELGQSFTPDRYGGFLQFAMWLMRPRVVRAYEHWLTRRSDALPWLEPIIKAVDRIYEDPTLRRFWRNSELVPNRKRPHPYQTDIPPEYSNVDRMYLLSTSLDPDWPWTADTMFEVMCIARINRKNGIREWLVYAYAPLGDKKNVRISIPEYKSVTIDVALSGSFFLLREPNNDPVMIVK